MLILVDTNVLLRRIQSGPSQEVARVCITSLFRAGHTLCLTPQNVAEFWNVCTRPLSANGLGFTVADTDSYTSRLEHLFTILPDSADVFRIWRRLVVDHAVMGAKVHDAKLAASMHVHSVKRIVTFNVADFARFSNVEAVAPNSFLPSLNE